VGMKRGLETVEIVTILVTDETAWLP